MSISEDSPFMNVSQDELRKAAAAIGLTTDRADLLWQALHSSSTERDRPRFDVANVAYYLGALIVIGAMGWFMNKAWEGLGGPGLFAAGVCYAVCFVWAGWTLWHK